MNKIKIFSGVAGIPLATKICERLSMPLGLVDDKRHNDGEVFIKLEEDVRDADVFIVNPTNPPAENFFDLCFLAKAARGSSANRVTLVTSYLGYNRQDRKDQARVQISARFIADMLIQTRADRILLLDLHSEATQGLFEPLIFDHLYGSNVAVSYLQTILKNDFVVASPDKGGGPRAEAYAHRLGLDDYVLFTKSRSKPGEIKKGSIKIIGDVEGKDVIFVDDIIDTAGTIVDDAEEAKKQGANNIYVFATHALFSNDKNGISALEKIERSSIKEVIVTDSIFHNKTSVKQKCGKITFLSVAPLLAEAIRRIHEGESLKSLII